MPWLVKIRSTAVAEDVVADPDVEVEQIGLRLAAFVDDASGAAVYLRPDARYKVVAGGVAWLPSEDGTGYSVVVTDGPDSDLVSRSDVPVADDAVRVERITEALADVDEIVEQL